MAIILDGTSLRIEDVVRVNVETHGFVRKVVSKLQEDREISSDIKNLTNTLRENGSLESSRSEAFPV